MVALGHGFLIYCLFFIRISLGVVVLMKLLFYRFFVCLCLCRVFRVFMGFSIFRGRLTLGARFVTFRLFLIWKEKLYLVTCHLSSDSWQGWSHHLILDGQFYLSFYLISDLQTHQYEIWLATVKAFPYHLYPTFSSIPKFPYSSFLSY